MDAREHRVIPLECQPGFPKCQLPIGLQHPSLLGRIPQATQNPILDLRLITSFWISECQILLLSFTPLTLKKGGEAPEMGKLGTLP